MQMKKYLKISLFCAMLGCLLVYLYNIYSLQSWWNSQREYVNTELNKEKSKAKILFVLNDMSATGAPMMALRLSKILKENGYAVAVMYGYIEDIRPEFEELKIPVVNALINRKNAKLYQEFASDFDLVIVNGERRIFDYAKASEVTPAIWWIHELMTELKYAVMGKFLNDDKKKEIIKRLEALEKIKTTKQYEPTDDEIEHKKTVDSIDAFKVYYNADIVTVSELARSFIYKYVKKDVEVINNGVDSAEIEDSLEEGNSDLYHSLLKDKNENNKIVFLQVGHVVKRKAVHLTLEAIRRLPKEYQDKIVLYIVGWNDNEYGDLLKETYFNLSNVKWVGQVSREVLNDYYRVADVLMVPSSRDPAPCVVTEAAMYGVPAIISNMVGSTYIIKDNDSGFIFPFPYVDILKDKIMHCIDNPDSCRKMGEKAKQYFYETSTKDMFAKKWLEKIENKLKEGK